MTEVEWLDCRTDSVRMLSALPRANNDRRFRLYAVALCRLGAALLENAAQQIEEAITVAEAFADGTVTEEALSLAQHHLAASAPRQATRLPVTLPHAHAAALRSIEYASAVLMRGIA